MHTLPEVVTSSSSLTRHQRYRFSSDIQEQIRKLNQLDNWHAPVGYARDVLVILAAGWLSLRVSWWLYPITVLLIGSRQRAFSNLLHESAHGILTRNRMLNLAFGTLLTAYPIMQSHYGYKQSHVANHHPHLGDSDRDPDLVYFTRQGVYRRASKRALWMRLVVLPAFGARALPHVWYLLSARLGQAVFGAVSVPAQSRFWRIRTRRDRIGLCGFWIAALTLASMSGNLQLTILFWFVPYLTAFQILGWYIELSEHTPMVTLHNIDLYMTRNRKSRWLERFLTGTYADHMHLDHHLDPRTPYWNLASAHRARMSDSSYAAADARFGGLFTKGEQGQPSAISSLIHDLARLHAPGHTHMTTAPRQ